MLLWSIVAKEPRTATGEVTRPRCVEYLAIGPERMADIESSITTIHWASNQRYLGENIRLLSKWITSKASPGVVRVSNEVKGALKFFAT